MPNQPKKQRKNASQVRWKVRMCGGLRLNSRIAVALPTSSLVFTRNLPTLHGRKHPAPVFDS